MTDPNGTTTALTYHPLGMVAAIVTTDVDGRGDTEQRPGTAFDYDLASFVSAGRPPSVHAKRRVWHASDAVSDEVVETREYSDGFGRLLQTRVQADVMGLDDDGDATGLLPDGAAEPAVVVEIPERVAVSGWQIRDNKGRVVAVYEPLFSTAGTTSLRLRRAVVEERSAGTTR